MLSIHTHHNLQLPCASLLKWDMNHIVYSPAASVCTATTSTPASAKLKAAEDLTPLLQERVRETQHQGAAPALSISLFDNEAHAHPLTIQHDGDIPSFVCGRIVDPSHLPRARPNSPSPYSPKSVNGCIVA